MNPLIILSSNGQVLKWEGFSHACKLKVKGLKVWRIYYTCISFIRNSMKSNKIWWPTFIELGYGILDQTIQPEVEMQLKNGLLILLAKNLIYLILKILIQTRKKKNTKNKKCYCNSTVKSYLPCVLALDVNIFLRAFEKGQATLLQRKSQQWHLDISRTPLRTTQAIRTLLHIISTA